MTAAVILPDVVEAVATHSHDVDEILSVLDADQLRGLVVELAHQVLAHETPSSEIGYGPDSICTEAIQLAAAAFGIPADRIASRDRHRPVADARAVAQMAARNLGLTLPEISGVFGQHHTTILHSIEKVANNPRLGSAATRITDLLADHFTGRAAA